MASRDHPAPALYPRRMATPAMEERIMELMPQDAKAALLLLGRRYPFEVTQALDSTTGKRS
jgi:hypothetical protein